jgi:hypothetical protein
MAGVSDHIVDIVLSDIGLTGIARLRESASPMHLGTPSFLDESCLVSLSFKNLSLAVHRRFTRALQDQERQHIVWCVHAMLRHFSRMALWCLDEQTVGLYTTKGREGDPSDSTPLGRVARVFAEWCGDSWDLCQPQAREDYLRLADKVLRELHEVGVRYG